MQNYNNKNALFEDRQEREINKRDIIYSDNFLPLKLNESWAGRRLIEALSQLPPSNFSSSLDVSTLFLIF